VISLHRREATTRSSEDGPDAGHAARRATMPGQPLTTTPRCYRGGGRRQAVLDFEIAWAVWKDLYGVSSFPEISPNRVERGRASNKDCNALGPVGCLGTPN